MSFGDEYPPTEELQCRVCGCLHFWGCANGCWWVEEDLCSNCADVDTDLDREIRAAIEEVLGL